MAFLLPRIAASLIAALPLTALAAPAPEAQREPEVKSAVQHAIDQAECFEDRYDSAVWYKMMEPRLRKKVPSRDERPGVKFADTELIGIPHRVVVGDRGLERGVLEYRHRRAEASEEFPANEALAWLRGRLAS